MNIISLALALALARNCFSRVLVIYQGPATPPKRLRDALRRLLICSTDEKQKQPATPHARRQTPGTRHEARARREARGALSASAPHADAAPVAFCTVVQASTESAPQFCSNCQILKSVAP